MRYAFELAKTRKRKEVASATKSNGISISMPYWDERFAAISKEYPGIKTSQFHIDILTAHLVRNPTWFDVIVGSNLFGDILSDLGPATTGTIAIAPGGNINPEKEFPSMFEPVHGSAPDIAGPRSDRISPNRLEPTITSNQCGLRTRCAVRMSMWNWLVLTPGIPSRWPRSARPSRASKSRCRSTSWRTPPPRASASSPGRRRSASRGRNPSC